MKTLTTKKIFTLILLMSGMFSFTTSDAQCFCSCDNHPSFNAYCVVRPNGTYRCKSVHHSACRGIDNTTSTPEVSSLEDIYPNPVSTSTTVSFYVGQKENVSLKIFDMRGSLIATLADASFEEGDHEIAWNATDVNAGIYFLRMEAAGYSENRKLIVTK